MSANATRELIGRIPLTSICTLNGARVDDLIVAVMVEDLERLEARAETAERVARVARAWIESQVDSGVWVSGTVLSALAAYEFASTPAAESEAG